MIPRAHGPAGGHSPRGPQLSLPPRSTGSSDWQSFDSSPVVAAGTIDVAVVWVQKAQKSDTQWVDECTDAQLQAYWVRRRLKPMGQLLKYGYLCLPFFEEPSWCAGGDLAACLAARPGMYDSPLPVVPKKVVDVLEVVCLLSLFVSFFLTRRSLGEAHVLGSWQKAGCVLAGVAVVDCTAACFNNAGITPGTPRLAHVCRPFVFLLFTRALRQEARRVLRSIPKVLDVLLALALSVVCFVWVGILLFAHTPEGSSRFASWFEAFASLWVLFTTANFPDVMIAAINRNRSSFLFFLLYLVITLFLINNILLAAVYDAYKEQLRANFAAAEANRHAALEKAFALLAGGHGEIAPETWVDFFLAYVARSKLERSWPDPIRRRQGMQRSLRVFESLGVDPSRGIKSRDFHHCIDAVLDGSIYIPSTSAPRVLRRRWAKALHIAMTHGFELCGRVVSWDHAADAVLFVNAAAILAQTALYVSHNFGAAPQQPAIWLVGLGMSCLYAAEVTLKLAVLGVERFWNRNKVQHAFDFVNAYGTLACELAFVLSGGVVPDARTLVLLRLVRSTRLLRHIRPLKKLWRLLMRMMPTYQQVGGLLFLVYYFYATIGVEFMGGLIYTTNRALEGSDFQKGSYWALSFNDLASGMMTLFVLMVVNNWYIIADGFLRVTDTRWSCLFFVSFFLMANLIVLNILVALIIECMASMQEEPKDRREHALPTTPEGEGDLQWRRRPYSSHAALRRVLLADVTPV